MFLAGEVIAEIMVDMYLSFGDDALLKAADPFIGPIFGTSFVKINTSFFFPVTSSGSWAHQCFSIPYLGSLLQCQVYGPIGL